MLKILESNDIEEHREEEKGRRLRQLAWSDSEESITSLDSGLTVCDHPFVWSVGVWY